MNADQLIDQCKVKGKFGHTTEERQFYEIEALRKLVRELVKQANQAANRR